MRNQATLAGSVVTGDGRSPLLAVLLALDASVHLEPGTVECALQDFLSQRPGSVLGRLIVALDLALGARLGYRGWPAARPIDRWCVPPWPAWTRGNGGWSWADSGTAPSGLKRRRGRCSG